MKFHGIVGFSSAVENPKGIFKQVTEERVYTGDLIKVGRRIETSSDQVNDGIRLVNKISFIRDPYSRENYFSIKYVIIDNVKWKVTDVDINSPPRIIVSLGGVYNG